ncbi:hypothetical protein SAY87_006792 [Trapa incisa]|uniref:Uncharacterized protein n=1 Tax=Trapa incisa TaxID=236973 RepID=A0AAN7Q4I2_9MYRT|nr:hypothetical protein SAY87_006792 [Trapa incisa]
MRNKCVILCPFDASDIIVHLSYCLIHTVPSNRYIPAMDELSSSFDPCIDATDSVMEKVIYVIHKSVQIVEDHQFDSTSGSDEFSECGGPKTTSQQKLLTRYESFPSPMSSYMDSEEPYNKLELASQGLFLKDHPPLKPASSMKGSREKRGVTKIGLRVTWASDVYDPLPTSVSHAVRRGTKSRNVSRKGKRHGKGCHNAKSSSRGSRSKDSSNGAGYRDKKKKKAPSKIPVSSNIWYKLSNPGNDLLDIELDQVEYGMRILDVSCGSSFMKTSLAKSHYPVAEAL